MFARHFAFRAFASVAALLLTLHGSGGELSAADPAKAESDVIDLETISRFHVKLEYLCFHRSIKVAYDGPLGQKLQSWGIRQKLWEGGPNPLLYSWSVVYSEGPDKLAPVLCNITISLKDSDKASYTCEVNGRKLYVSVETVSARADGKLVPDSMYPELRDLKVSDLIAKTTWSVKKKP